MTKKLLLTPIDELAADSVVKGGPSLLDPADHQHLPPVPRLALVGFEIGQDHHFMMIIIIKIIIITWSVLMLVRIITL